MKILPQKRSHRVAAYAVATLIYATVLWFWVFPWLDRTFINRPAIG